MISVAFGVLVIVTIGGHFGNAEIRIPKAARKFKTKDGFRIDARMLIG